MLDLLVLVVMTRLFLAINVFSLSALVAFGAILLVLVLLNHRWVFAAKQAYWNFVELRETDFMITVANTLGPASKTVSYDNVRMVRIAERLSVTWMCIDRYTFADFWPHRPPATTSIGWFGPAPHVEVHLHHPIRIPIGANRLLPFVRVIHFGVDDDAALSAQLMERAGLM